MSKKKKDEPGIKDYVAQIHDTYKRWKHLYNEGGSDPSWEDGTNLNLLRNHILYYRGKIEELCGDNFFRLPDELYWPIPPIVPQNFMATERYLPIKGATLPASPRTYVVNW